MIGPSAGGFGDALPVAPSVAARPAAPRGAFRVPWYVRAMSDATSLLDDVLARPGGPRARRLALARGLGQASRVR